MEPASKTLMTRTYSEGSYGSVLKNIFNDADALAQNLASSAEQTGKDLMIAAAKQVELAAANMGMIFEEEMEKVADQVTGIAGDFLNQLKTMQNQLKETTTDFKDLKGRALLLTKNLIPSKKENQPVLLGTTPTHLVIIAEAVTLVVFEGVFPQAALEEFKPRFFIGAQEQPLRENKETRLVFEILPSCIPAAAAHKFTYLSNAHLEVLWDRRWWYFWREKQTSVYQVALSALPPNPGPVVNALYKVTKPHHDERPMTAGHNKEYSLYGLNYNGTGLHRATKDFTIYPTKDWKINPRVQPQVAGYLEKGNDCGVINLTASPAGVTFTLWVNVHHEGNNNNGFLAVLISYGEERDWEENDQRSEDQSSIRWQEQRRLTPRQNETFAGMDIVDYRGISTQLGASPDTRTVIHLSSGAMGEWLIRAVPPKDDEI